MVDNSSLSHPPSSSWSGLFLVFEGLDGSGKTTQCNKLADFLNNLGYVVVQTQEPTHGPWGQKIRSMAQSGQRASATQELEWFVQDRKEHIQQLILPALQQGKIVIQDRYYLSTAAYQGSRGIDVAHILQLHQTFAPPPDRTFLLQIPPEEGLLRIQHGRKQTLDAFETLANLQQCASIFDHVEMPGLVRLNGQMPPEQLHQLIIAELKPALTSPTLSKIS